MASEDDIRCFIQQQREAGAFDSTGQFSLDLRKARAKSQLAHQDLEGAHLLYWLLAASYFTPKSVSLNFTSVRTTGEVRLGWEELQKIARGSGHLDPPEKMLHRAIVACAALATSPPRLTYSQEGEGSFTMDLASGEVTSDRYQGVNQIAVEFPRAATAAKRAAEVRQLESRCGFSYVLPRYDNRELTEENVDGYRGRPPCTSLWNTYTHPGYLLALRQCKKVMDRSGFLVAEESNFKSTIPRADPDHSVFLLKRDQECWNGRSDRIIGIPLALEGPGFVRLIFRGIVLESFPYDLGVPGAWVVACVDHLTTDLSGLKLVRDKQFDILLRGLSSQTQGLAKEALVQLDRFVLPEGPVQEQPGLLVRLMLWAFAPREERDSKECPRANAGFCRDEIRRRLTQTVRS